MSKQEKARLSDGPIPEILSLQDNRDTRISPLRLQTFLLIRRLSISAPMAEAIAPLVYGSEVWR
jgi:hypothetical protein